MPPAHGDSTALLTDQYELTMLAGALAGGSAFRRCTFEVFTRELRGHRYGIVVGVPRLLDAVARFRFGDEQLAFLTGMLDRGHRCARVHSAARQRG